MNALQSLLALVFVFGFSQVHALTCRSIFAQPTPHQQRAKYTVKEIEALSKSIASLGGYSKVTKFLIDLRHSPDGEAVFFDTNKYSYHHDFVTSELGCRDTLEVFQGRNYDGSFKRREFILGSFAVKTSPGKQPEAMVELFSGDTMDSETMALMMNAIERKLSGFSSIRFHPLSGEQEAFAQRGLGQKRIILTSTLAQGLSYLPINKGKSVGYVRIVKKAEFEAGRVLVGASDLVIFDQVPNDIGLVSGVVTAELQTALSHINVKSINRGTPNIYLKNAESQFAQYEGRPVEFEATSEGYSIKNLTSHEADRRIADFWAARRKPLAEKPSYVLDPRLNGKVLDLSRYYERLPTKEEHRELILRVGAKAANLALLQYIVKSKKLPVKIQPPAALPFNAHEAFLNLRQKGLDLQNPKKVSTVKDEQLAILKKYDLLNKNRVHDIQSVSNGLKEIGELYQRAHVPEETLSALKRMIHEDRNSPIHFTKQARLRFRSSTNSEDLEGFTGAGLYDSLGINLYKKLSDGGFDMKSPRSWKKIEEDLREKLPLLYKSVFNERAFMEREWFGINGKMHLEIKAAQAIHGAFPLKGFDGEAYEVANGVAITTDIYRDKSDYPKIFINAQHYDLSVTNPPSHENLESVGERPDQKYSSEELMVSTYLADFTENARPDSWVKWPINKIRSTSIRGGEGVLKSQAEGGELRKLAYAIREINKSLAEVFEKPDADEFPIDIEFKIVGPEREIYLKQVRPFVRPGGH